MDRYRFSTLVCLITACLLNANLAQAQLSPIAVPTRTNYSPDAFSSMLREAGQHLAAVSAKTSPAVVHIESSRQGRNGELEETGSGVLMSSARDSGLFVVTNRHVIAGAQLQNIEILLSDGHVIRPSQKLEDQYSDIAVLKVANIDIQPAEWGDSDNLEIGHFVLAMGSPFGLSQSVTLGIISAKGRRSLELPGRRVINQDFLQTDAAINPGNSGGPLVDLNGRIIGINTAIASQGGGNEGIGFSIPSNLVRFIVNQLLEHGEVHRAYLGVELDENFDNEAARRYNLDRKYGARVTRVIAQTPAERAGLQPDDIVLNFDGIEIQDENDLINRVSLTPINKRVRMIVLRDGRQVNLYVVLAERQEQQSARPFPNPDDSKYRNSGLSVLKLESDLALQVGFLSDQQGLLVQSAAADATPDQLNLYDVIVEVARKPVRTVEDLEAVLDESESQSLLVKVVRIVDGKPQPRLVVWQRSVRN